MKHIICHPSSRYFLVNIVVDKFIVHRISTNSVLFIVVRRKATFVFDTIENRRSHVNYLSRIERERLGHGSGEVKEYARSLLFLEREFYILVGILISDGHISVITEGETAKFRVGHTSEKEAYVYWLFDILDDLVPAGPRKTKDGKTISFYSYSLPLFLDLHSIFYERGSNGNWIKIVPSDLGEYLTAEGLAFVYSCDGTVTRYSYILCTDSFTYEGHLIFQSVLKDKFGLDSRIIKFGDKFRLEITSIDKFREIVLPYTHPDFYYKIHSDYLLTPSGEKSLEYFGLSDLELLHKSSSTFKDVDREKVVLPSPCNRFVRLNWGSTSSELRDYKYHLTLTQEQFDVCVGLLVFKYVLTPQRGIGIGVDILSIPFFFRISFIKKSSDFSYWLDKLFDNWTGSPPLVKSSDTISIYGSVIWTKFHQVFTIIDNDLSYRGYIPVNFSYYLNARVLSVIYMIVGVAKIGKYKGYILDLCSFPESECIIFQKALLSNFSIDSVLYYKKSTRKSGYYLIVEWESNNRFREVVFPYLLEKYKTEL